VVLRRSRARDTRAEQHRGEDHEEEREAGSTSTHSTFLERGSPVPTIARD
jgi:hypothetical protein